MKEKEINKDKLIEYLQTRCTQLWEENESFKFQNTLEYFSGKKIITLNDNKVKRITKSSCEILSGSWNIGLVYKDKDEYYINFSKEFDISITELKNIIKLIENGSSS